MTSELWVGERERYIGPRGFSTLRMEAAVRAEEGAVVGLCRACRIAGERAMSRQRSSKSVLALKEGGICLLAVGDVVV